MTLASSTVVATALAPSSFVSAPKAPSLKVSKALGAEQNSAFPLLQKDNSFKEALANRQKQTRSKQAKEAGPEAKPASTKTKSAKKPAPLPREEEATRSFTATAAPQPTDAQPLLAAQMQAPSSLASEEADASPRLDSGALGEGVTSQTTNASTALPSSVPAALQGSAQPPAAPETLAPVGEAAVTVQEAPLPSQSAASEQASLFASSAAESLANPTTLQALLEGTPKNANGLADPERLASIQPGEASESTSMVALGAGANAVQSPAFTSKEGNTPAEDEQAGESAESSPVPVATSPVGPLSPSDTTALLLGALPTSQGTLNLQAPQPQRVSTLSEALKTGLASLEQTPPRPGESVPTSTVHLQLNPLNLGPLRVQVRQMAGGEGAVEARFMASTPQSAQLLQQDMALLRQSLEAKGLAVGSLQVQVVGQVVGQVVSQAAKTLSPPSFPPSPPQEGSGSFASAQHQGNASNPSDTWAQQQHQQQYLKQLAQLAQWQ
jgi:hypothetical protein